MNMTRKEIGELAEKVADLTRSGKSEAALQSLKPVLDCKCPFAKLDTLGQHIGKTGENPKQFFETFDRIINYNAMGGFVIVGQALIQFLPNNFELVMEKKSRIYH